MVTTIRPRDAAHAALPAPIVAFESVDVAYRDRTVLRDVSFEVEPGQRVALVGPNGAGKSSLLRALAGLVPLRHGEIRLDGKPVRFESPADALAYGIGMLHQDPLDVGVVEHAVSLS